MLGIALGMTALITVMSVMNGFQVEIRTRIIGAASHIQVTGKDGALADWNSTAVQAQRNAQVIASAPFVHAEGLLSAGQTVHGAAIRGVLPDYEDQVADIGRHMKAGALTNLRSGEFGILLGSELARALQVANGDKVTLVAPQGKATRIDVVPRLKQFTVVGVFEVGHFQIDETLALIHLADAQQIYQLGDAVSGVRLKLSDPMLAPRVAYELNESLSAKVFISDWTRQYANYFRALQDQKRMMSLILTLIVAVAVFNIVSALVLVVTEKHSAIAILRTLGASPGSIMKIFMVQGAIIGVAGTILGLIGGLLLAYNVSDAVSFIERAFGVQFLTGEVYFIKELPSDPRLSDISIIGGVSFVLTFLATLYPSYRAARVRPAEALRYE